MIMPTLDFGALAAPAICALNALSGFSIALLAALLLRHPLRRFSGPRIAYALWLLPPGAVLVAIWAALAPTASPLRRGTDVGALVVAQTASIAATRTPVSVGAGLLGVWIAGCALSLLILILRYASLRRGLRPAPYELRALQAPHRDIARKLRIRAHAAGPALLWAPRPLLLLPADFTRRYSRTQQTHILHHELCHHAQGDPWWNLLAALLGALFWFHPLLPWARRCFLLDQELACDALLLQSRHAAPRAYADTLLLAATGTIPPLTSGVAHPRQLQERIAMLAQTRRSATRRAAGAILVLILLSGAVLAAPGGRLVAIKASVDVQPVSQDIRYNQDLPPHYPAAAAKGKAQGTVYLAVLVGTQGLPLAIRQWHEPGPQPAQSLVSAALQAVAQWHFKPGMRDGKPVAGWVKVPIQFELQKHPWKAPASAPAA